MRRTQNSTIALFASARRHGNTGRLMDRVAGALNIEVVDLAALDIAPYDYGHANRGDDFEPLMERVLDFEQIIFASPVYWYAVSPPMKIFLDRISDFLDLPELLDQGRRLRGKTGFVLCTSVCHEIDAAYLDAYQKTFRHLGMRMGGWLHADCGGGYRAADYESEVAAFMRRLASDAAPDQTGGDEGRSSVALSRLA